MVVDNPCVDTDGEPFLSFSGTTGPTQGFDTSSFVWTLHSPDLVSRSSLLHSSVLLVSFRHEGETTGVGCRNPSQTHSRVVSPSRKGEVGFENLSRLIRGQGHDVRHTNKSRD